MSTDDFDPDAVVVAAQTADGLSDFGDESLNLTLDQTIAEMAEPSALSPQEMSDLVVEFVRSQGACAVGISTTETLAGGPPSTDLDYVLEGARSAITFALPLDQEKILKFLRKEDHSAHQADNLRTTAAATGIAQGLADYLNQLGIPSYGVSANLVSRDDKPDEFLEFHPDVSHRYLAVRSGVGWLGFSGNLLTEQFGANVLLGTTVTTAELVATDPLPKEKRYCDECQLCRASCNSGFFGTDGEMTDVMIGGEEFSYTKRSSPRRCDFVCGGFTGLSKDEEWSTWSPARFGVPDEEEEVLPRLVEAVVASGARPEFKGEGWESSGGGFYHPTMVNHKVNISCAHCQLICHPDKEERKRRYKVITESGVVVQHEDGTLEAVSSDQARKHLLEMSPERRALYGVTSQNELEE